MPTPGKTPPEVSVTVPWSVPVTVWAVRSAGATASVTRTNRIVVSRIGRFGVSAIRPPSREANGRTPLPPDYSHARTGSRRNPAGPKPSTSTVQHLPQRLQSHVSPRDHDDHRTVKPAPLSGQRRDCGAPGRGPAQL